ncbi:MAG: hypothetical protein H7Z12_08555, partial [Rhodospirillaceae bacterium]|nr:hypothetical protein [Rhodospirillales bacterium]
RQPLRMVTSYLTLLERRYAGSLDDDAHAFIGYARDGALRMDRLILDLLSLSRIGRTSKPLEATAFSQVLTNALAVLQEELADTGISIAVPRARPSAGDQRRLAPQRDRGAAVLGAGQRHSYPTGRFGPGVPDFPTPSRRRQL